MSIIGDRGFWQRKHSGQSGSWKDRFDADLKRRRKLFTKALITKREILGLSQSDLARMVGCSQSVVARGEQGKPVDFVLFERWAAILAGSISRFRYLDPGTMTDPKWMDEPLYEGKPISEWKFYLKMNHWPTLPGFGTLSKNNYKKTGLFSGHGSLKWQYRKQLKEVQEIAIPSPS
jgi:transcriptional regulator with XRE-family HTH domain